MVDTKKLLVGFLILAAAAGSSAFIISATTGGSSVPLAVNDAATANSGSATTAPLGGNAFVASQAAPIVDDGSADALTDPTLTSATGTQAVDPNNLTAVLAGSFLNNLVSVNPDGIQTTADGNMALTPPDNDEVIAQLTKSDAFKNLNVPNWDIEAAGIPIMVTASSSSGDLASYSSAVQNAFNKYFVQTNLQGTMGQNADLSTAGYVHDQVQSALQNIGELKVPAPAANLQRSLVKLLVYEKNLAGLAQNLSGNDPLRATLVLQAQSPKYSAALMDFENQLQKNPAGPAISFGATFQQKPSGVTAFFQNLVGIKTANAQWLTFDAAAFGQMLLKYLEDLALQIIKNEIIKELQGTVLKWIQGSGAPRFIQNWGTTLVNAYTTEATNVLNQQMKCVNPVIVPRLSLLLQSPAIPNSNSSGFCAAQFQNQLSSGKLTQLYNSFEQGGLDSYLKLFQPGGNDFGAMIDIQDQAMTAGGNSQNAQQTKSIAGQGWTGDAKCADNSSPTGAHNRCVTPKGVTYDLFPGETSCQAGDFKEEVGNGGKCADGKDPIVTSPDQSTGQVFGSSVDSASKLIVSASGNDFAALFNALTSSLLNSLTQKALSSI